MNPMPYLEESGFGSFITPQSMDVDNVNDLLEVKNLESDKNLNPLEKNVLRIKKDMIEFINSDWDDINNEIKKKGNHKEDKTFDFNEEKNQLHSLREKLIKIKNEYQSLEIKLKTQFSKNKLLEKKMTDFINFINEYETNNKEKECDKLKESLTDFSTKYNDSESLRDTISLFVDKRKELTELLSLTRYIQDFQPVPTCPLCLSNPLDSFLDPCGHTGCKECFVRSIQSDNVHLNCPVCRKNIGSIKPLYIL